MAKQKEGQVVNSIDLQVIMVSTMDKNNETAFPIATLTILQGLYLFLTGIWPLLHIQSFMAVTGPKEDLWLVKTVGVLMIAIGIGLCMAGVKRKLSSPVILIAVLAAMGLFFIDAVYVVKNVIWPIYLLDAGIELLLLVFWMIFLVKQQDINKPQVS